MAPSYTVPVMVPPDTSVKSVPVVFWPSITVTGVARSHWVVLS